jgi:predicted nucleic acid-binding protein
MVLIDTGPLVALFDPADPYHTRTKSLLEDLESDLYTTSPVLTETFHLLGPATKGSDNIRTFIRGGGVLLYPMSRIDLMEAFRLMDQYADKPMDFADASLVTAARDLDIYRIFTVDRDDFQTYEFKSGHRHKDFKLIDPAKH